MTSQLDALYHELTAYTLGLRDSAFMHQHVVDAYAAQTADETSKPIAITFALIGLCLYLERGFTGRQVQRVHMLLAQRRRTWPRFLLPTARTSVTVRDVLSANPGSSREMAIHDRVRKYLESELES
jgi:hypothetical protein